MPLEVAYRAVETPLVRTKGFVAGVPLTIEQARDFIRLYTGIKQLHQCNFLHLVRGGQLVLENNTIDPRQRVARTPLDLKEYIIRSKLKGASISTDLTENCGGYASRPWRYRIDLGVLEERPWSAAGPNVVLPPLISRSQMPTLCLNEPELGTATWIAILMPPGADSRELTFFTEIPREFLTVVKRPANAVEPETEVAPKKLDRSKFANFR
ncbi:MAG TPA: hypothetical protein VN681_05725 [Stellaceae bacterium]|nr:hypothetical protein [Stellaceae bacterium]